MPDGTVFDLAGTTALVTGGASGIGLAIVETFVAAGARVVAADLDADGLAGLAERLGVRTIVLDVTDEDGVEAAVASVDEESGGIQVLVNAAGVLTQAPLEELTTADWARVMAIDLTGVFLVMRAVGRRMLRDGHGRIINLASQLAIKGGSEVAHYAAAKAGVIALTKSAAIEWSGRGVLVNAIAPGPIVSPMTDRMTAQWRTDKAAELPIGRFGVPAEVAPTALLLASSPAGDLYTGQTLGPNSGDVMP
ncbi:SDR family NAD(P)-dependent oxidoreductase [Curtobacterium flaccumfaciens]|uniref:SDR family NAD(P)-dependent oxidoreductase n=1 Tax=Curtobacterium flaccumfaciens TaxID=2035 RepID=UPI000FFEE119|nr:SDR family NAD(P)-dependent oxidoreductase [Curtobacterium flaccumfaciens]MCS0647375.1 SDR family oxidoreductase [Curtobacterium flaccumfaciens pv. flaccumfaciens]MCS6524970.1 SDR family oxidoreductase [Curtobacterium flaccumfaciens pv. flaccumfaciens]MCS6530116.1 SDR family oxidoreductase [Curtobacterium flaccumfaciens pv. flaccumfaciens]NUU10062.1 SDR family oxidoreductase [Curtobacterium flaccumfaciens]RXF85012.1 3-oxoacyl-ACP reductase [Curtobacterium flaccumfaciens pv. flaccumfaciens]